MSADVLTGLLTVMCVLLMAVGVILWVRNGRVYRARTDLLARISKAAEVDISNGHSWQWRYREYDSVSYERMVLHFWRDPLSLYDDLSFADEPLRESA